MGKALSGILALWPPESVSQVGAVWNSNCDSQEEKQRLLTSGTDSIDLQPESAGFQRGFYSLI